MRLNQQTRGRGAEGGAQANVHRGAMDATSHSGVGGVDAVRGQHEPGDWEIRGGETEFAAAGVAMDYLAGERVRSAKHLPGGVEIATANGLTDAGATDRFTVQGHRAKAMNGEAQFDAKFFEQRDVPAPLVAEDEVAADAEAGDPNEIVCKLADEFFGGLFAEGFVEVEEQGGVCIKCGDGTEFLRDGLQQWREMLRSDDGVGMSVEGDNDGEAFVLTSVGDGLADDLLVAEVDAVKHTDGEGDFARASIEFVGVPEDFHRSLRQFEKGDDACEEFARGRLDDLLHFDGVGHGELTGVSAAEVQEMGAAAEFLA